MSSSYPNQSPHISKSADPKIPFIHKPYKSTATPTPSPADPKIPFIHKPYKSIPKQKSPLIKEEASFTEINKIS